MTSKTETTKTTKTATKSAKTKRVAKTKARKTKADLPEDGKIVVLHKGCPHRSAKSKRGQKWACLKGGRTVKSAVAAMNKKKLRTPAAYIKMVRDQGLIKIQ